MQSITDEETDRVIGWLFGTHERRDNASSKVHAIGNRRAYRDRAFPSCVTIKFIPDAMVVAVKPRSDLRVELHQVLSRPTHLQFMVERHAEARQNGPGGPGVRQS